MLNRERGMTVILTTHYLEEAEEMCDEIAIIDNGQKIAQDSTTNLLDQLDGRVMVVQPSAAPTSIPTLPNITVEHRTDGSLAFAYQARQTSADQVIDAVRQSGIGIADIRTEQARLEDVFLALTAKRPIK